jgi:hypothetical protein
MGRSRSVDSLSIAERARQRQAEQARRARERREAERRRRQQQAAQAPSSNELGRSQLAASRQRQNAQQARMRDRAMNPVTDDRQDLGFLDSLFGPSDAERETESSWSLEEGVAHEATSTTSWSSLQAKNEVSSTLNVGMNGFEALDLSGFDASAPGFGLLNPWIGAGTKRERSSLFQRETYDAQGSWSAEDGLGFSFTGTQRDTLFGGRNGTENGFAELGGGVQVEDGTAGVRLLRNLETFTGSGDDTITNTRNLGAVFNADGSFTATGELLESYKQDGHDVELGTAGELGYSDGAVEVKIGGSETHTVDDENRTGSSTSATVSWNPEENRFEIGGEGTAELLVGGEGRETTGGGSLIIQDGQITGINGNLGQKVGDFQGGVSGSFERKDGVTVGEDLSATVTRGHEIGGGVTAGASDETGTGASFGVKGQLVDQTTVGLTPDGTRDVLREHVVQQMQAEGRTFDANAIAAATDAEMERLLNDSPEELQDLLTARTAELAANNAPEDLTLDELSTLNGGSVSFRTEKTVGMSASASKGLPLLAVSAGLSSSDTAIEEVTVEDADQGVSIQWTVANSSQAGVEGGVSLLSLEATAGEGNSTSIGFDLDVSTAEGEAQYANFMEHRILPGAEAILHPPQSRGAFDPAGFTPEQIQAANDALIAGDPGDLSVRLAQQGSEGQSIGLLGVDLIGRSSTTEVADTFANGRQGHEFTRSENSWAARGGEDDVTKLLVNPTTDSDIAMVLQTEVRQVEDLDPAVRAAYADNLVDETDTLTRSWFEGRLPDDRLSSSQFDGQRATLTSTLTNADLAALAADVTTSGDHDDTLERLGELGLTLQDIGGAREVLGIQGDRSIPDDRQAHL